MPDTPSITIVKEFTYRGKPEQFSNRYHFTGSTPNGDAAWKTLADALIAAERPTVDNTVKFVKAYGYAASVDNAVAVIDYAIAPNVVLLGSMNFPSGGRRLPGDAAIWIRGNTGIRGAKGKFKYTRKYMHSIFGTGEEGWEPSQKTAMATFGGKLIDGTLPGNFKWCTPQGDVALAVQVSANVTTRTLKRRGKRPSS